MHTDIEFGIVYYSKGERFRSAAVIQAADYWEACEVAWDRLPRGAVDFQIVDEPAAIADGLEGVAAAAAALLAERQSRRAHARREYDHVG